MSNPMFSPDSGISSLSEEPRQTTTTNHRRKQELIALEDVDEMQTIMFGESLGVPDGIHRFFPDPLDYVEREVVVPSEDADSVGVLSLTDRSNKCFEEFMQMGEDSARGNELENQAGAAQDPLSNLLAESGIQFYSPAEAAAGPSAEEELSMMDLLNDPEPEPEEQTSHFVRRSQRKRSVRLEELVEEDSEEECTPRRKGGRSKARRRGKSWSRRPRSQPAEERAGAGPSHQQHQGTQQQFLLQQSPFLPQEQQQPSQELQQQQQLQALQQQLQLPQLQLFQQFPQQQHQLSQQMAQQQQQQQQFIQLQPPPMPQQQQAQQQQPQPMVPPPQQLFALPATAAVDSSQSLLGSWNFFMWNFVQKLSKEKKKLLDDRLNARILGILPPIQREPGWLEELLGDEEL